MKDKVMNKRPKDMTDEELASIPVRLTPSLTYVPRSGLAGDDLLGFWEDDDGQWYREPWMP